MIYAEGEHLISPLDLSGLSNTQIKGAGETLKINWGTLSGPSKVQAINPNPYNSAQTGSLQSVSPTSNY